MTQILARGLGRTYAGRVALSATSFDLAEGQVTALVGSNGAGKSTLIRRMLELTHGDGHTLFDGCRYPDLDRPASIVGLSLDAFHLNPRQSVSSHLAMVAARSRVPAARQRQFLGILGLDSVATRRIGALSLGMRQRLTLGAALVASPPVLILDEPTNGLDQEGIQWLRDLVRTRAQDGCTVLMSSHQFSEVEAVGDNVLALRRGHLVFDGRLTSLLNGRHQDEVVLECGDSWGAAKVLRSAGADCSIDVDGSVRVRDRDANFVARWVLDAGIALREIRSGAISLAEAYAQLMDEPSGAGWCDDVAA